MGTEFTTSAGQTITFDFTHEGLMNGVAAVEAESTAWNGRAGGWFLSNLGVHVSPAYGRPADELLTDAWMILTGRSFDGYDATDIAAADDIVVELMHRVTKGAWRAKVAEEALTDTDASRNGKLAGAWIDGAGDEAYLKAEAANDITVPGSSAHFTALSAELHPEPRRADAGLSYVENLLVLAGKSPAGAAAVIASVSDALGRCAGVAAASGTDACAKALQNAVNFVAKNEELAAFHQLTSAQWRSLVTLLLGNTTGLPSAVAVIAGGGNVAEFKHIRMAAKKLALAA